jgi:hypothetical protein
MIIKQKQSLVYKVPSGVAIMWHVYDIVAISVHSQVVSGKYGECGRQGILVFYQWESGNESHHLVFGQ